MDGVLVDFDKGYFDLTGINIKGTHRSDDSFFVPITKAGKSFWINLEWKIDGKSYNGRVKQSVFRMGCKKISAERNNAANNISNSNI